MSKCGISLLGCVVLGSMCQVSHAGGYWKQDSKVGTEGPATAPATHKLFNPGQTGDQSDISGQGGTAATYNMVWMPSYAGEAPKDLKVTHFYSYGAGKVWASVTGPNGTGTATSRLNANITRFTQTDQREVIVNTTTQNATFTFAAGNDSFIVTLSGGATSIPIEISVSASNASRAQSFYTTTTTVEANTNAHSIASDNVNFYTIP